MFAKSLKVFPTDEKFEKMLSKTARLEILVYERYIELTDVENHQFVIIQDGQADTLRYFLDIFKSKHFRDSKFYHMQYKDKLYTVKLQIKCNEKEGFRYIFNVSERKISLRNKLTEYLLHLRIKFLGFFGLMKNKRKS